MNGHTLSLVHTCEISTNIRAFLKVDTEKYNQLRGKASEVITKPKLEYYRTSQPWQEKSCKVLQVHLQYMWRKWNQLKLCNCCRGYLFHEGSGG